MSAVQIKVFTTLENKTVFVVMTPCSLVGCLQDRVSTLNMVTGGSSLKVAKNPPDFTVSTEKTTDLIT